MNLKEQFLQWEWQKMNKNYSIDSLKLKIEETLKQKIGNTEILHKSVE